ncbi:DUF185-domain-containing protein [Gonapodya prolifera JEL478]|uniref:Protein arginine methyltransferase NDUFAF7 n=1 Tax=Gonapodya prolifera (strain JEL478) TaxID=1344416 RepID=A0A139AM39_GONPJ|nr:DUF185-domain-containing protein [Gonapodya prolifera JEL478]|eukprot:KXS17525.1 DUF185-domain-containing protein [Gonapodya prolifera JEL478]
MRILPSSHLWRNETRCLRYPHLRTPTYSCFVPFNQSRTKSNTSHPETFHQDTTPHNSPSKEHETPLTKILKDTIRISGPRSVAQFMRFSLTNPSGGYYMQGDVFGKKGDFVTSPEISQMFGECVGVWLVTQWESLGKPSRFNILELGPGRGTLMNDVLRTSTNFAAFHSCIETVHLVEAGPSMRSMQARKLVADGHLETSDTSKDHKDIGFEGPLKGVRQDGIEVAWWGSFVEVPEGENLSSSVPTITIAHEFFDALPIHRFELTPNGWREIMIDVDESDTSPYHFRYVLSPNPTPASAAYTLNERFKNLSIGSRIEFCPEGAALIDQIARRVQKEGGSALIMDYGHDRHSAASLRAIKDHKFVDVLSNPGTTDLSADVDYSMMKDVISDHAVAFGPVTQSRFLHSLGIRERLMALLRSTKSSHVSQDLLSQYERLTALEQMGDIYKVMAVGRKESTTPVGFE